MTSSAPDLIDQIINSYPSSSANNDAAGAGGGAIGPAAPKKENTYKDFENLLESTPMFMRSTPKDGESNDVLEALRTLVFEGEGDEIATNFKNHGNELHGQKSYSEAIKAYTSGLEANPTDQALRISLLNNRAACHLLLKNYRSVLKDAGVIIALYTASTETLDKVEGQTAAKSTVDSGAEVVEIESEVDVEGEDRKDVTEQPKSSLKVDKALVKAMFRAAQSLIALERWKEAQDVVQRGQGYAAKVLGEDEKVWIKLSDDIAKGVKREFERSQRIRKEKLDLIALKQATIQRGLIVVDTNSPPDNPNPLHFDPDSIPEPATDSDYLAPPIETPLIFPVFLLYPSHGQSDFITHFHENTSFQDQLDVIFPSNQSGSQIPFAEWDTKREYYTSNIVIYVETAAKRLLKVGKELTLREVLTKAKREAKGEVTKDGVVLRDGLMSFVVLVKGQQEKAWIEEFKRKRDTK